MLGFLREAFSTSPESFNLYMWEAEIKCRQNHHTFLINGPDYLLIQIVHLKHDYLLSNFQLSYWSFWFLINLQNACWMKTRGFIVWPLLPNFYSVKNYYYFLWNLQNSPCQDACSIFIKIHHLNGSRTIAPKENCPQPQN